MSSTVVDDRTDRAFERLYERYGRDVYRYVLTLLRNPADAEDVTQATFLNAYRALQAGEEPLRPQNWLITIAHNACRSRVRWSMRRPEVPLDDVISQLAVPEPERPNIRELLRALGRLPSNQRTALTMRELEGRPYPEIAERLGVSVGAVEALIARARRTLRLQASALRGLTVLLLPRSVRRLFETGEAAVGGGAAAKVAAVLVAGTVAGGVGSVIVDARTPAAPRTPSLPSLQHDPALEAKALRTAFVTAGPVRRSAVLARPAPAAQAATDPGVDAAVPPAPTVPSGPVQPQSQPQSQAQAPQSQPHAEPGQVVSTVQQTASDAVLTAPVALPPQPALPLVAPPPVDLPTAPPAVPPGVPPSVPQPPDLPSLPLP
jgi:RNA polymerase sigma factor (sigma-70 family)